MMPLDPALSPERILRVLTISADLLPGEIVAARRARRARTVVLATLVLAVALLGGWYGYAHHQVRLAGADLADITGEATALQRGQNRYQDVVDVQNQTKTIAKQLNTLLADDLPWASLLTTVRDTGTSSGVAVQGVIGALNRTTNGAAPAASGTLPTASGVTTIGTLTVTGTGPDKPSIAKYVDALGGLTTVANPYLTNATQNNGAVTFSITLDITAAARCGRFTTACTVTGGK
jgi:hypothetical protein